MKRYKPLHARKDREFPVQRLTNWLYAVVWLEGYAAFLLILSMWKRSH